MAKFVKIYLTDGNTGEVIYETKSNMVGSSSYLRQKIQKNVNSFCNYFRDHPDRDVCLQISITEERQSMLIDFPADVY